MKRIIGVIYIFWISVSLFSVDINELENKLINCPPQQQAEILVQLSYAHQNDSPELVIRYGTQAMELARKYNNKKDEADALNNIGLGHINLGNYETGLEFYYRAQRIYDELGDQDNIAVISSRIGNVYWYYGDFEKTLEYYTRSYDFFKNKNDSLSKKRTAMLLNNRASVYIRWQKYDLALEDLLTALEIKKEIGDKASVAATLDNIGTVHKKLEDFDNALKFHNSALTLLESINDKRGIARVNNNIGIINLEKKQYNAAFKHFENALKLNKEIGNKFGIGLILRNMGDLHRFTKKFDDSFRYYNQSLSIRNEIKDKEGIARILCELGINYKELNKLEDALEYFNKSLELAKVINAKEIILDNYQQLSEIYSNMRNSEKSLYYFKMYTKCKDEVLNLSTVSKIRGLQVKYETGEMQKKVIRSESNRKKILGYSISGISFLLLLLAIVLYNRNRIKRMAELQLAENAKQIRDQKEKLIEFHWLKNRKKYENSNLSPQQADEYLNRLLEYVEKEHIFKDPNLTLDKLARKLSINRKALSQVINEKLNKNFSDFINYYRIEAAKKLLNFSGEEKEITILDIGYTVGFNSKTSFNTVFKKMVGITPSMYREKYKNH